MSENKIRILVVEDEADIPAFRAPGAGERGGTKPMRPTASNAA